MTRREARGELRWTFTINNPTAHDEEAVLRTTGSEVCTKAVVGREVGEDGTPHLQGFAVFRVPVTRRTMEEAVGGRAYLEVMRGRVRQNVVYCSKEGNVMVQKGLTGEEKGTDAKRTREDKFRQILDDARHCTPDEFADRQPEQWLLRRGAVERLMLEEAGKRIEVWDGDLPSKNIWLWGAPGVGKSQWASIQTPICCQYKKNLNKWWDGFSPLIHRQITIEDWHPGAECLSQHLKLWGDRYPFIAEVKGSSIQMEPGKWLLIVTSNYSIDQCFREEDRPAIHRRFCEIEMTEENKVRILATRIVME
jgi:hypothetical protein